MCIRDRNGIVPKVEKPSRKLRKERKKYVRHVACKCTNAYQPWQEGPRYQEGRWRQEEVKVFSSCYALLFAADTRPQPTCYRLCIVPLYSEHVPFTGIKRLVCRGTVMNHRLGRPLRSRAHIMRASLTYRREPCAKHASAPCPHFAWHS